MTKMFNAKIKTGVDQIQAVMSNWVTRVMLLLLGLWSFPPQPNTHSTLPTSAIATPINHPFA
jgi:hypothetical protein